MVKKNPVAVEVPRDKEPKEYVVEIIVRRKGENTVQLHKQMTVTSDRAYAVYVDLVHGNYRYTGYSKGFQDVCSRSTLCLLRRPSLRH